MGGALASPAVPAIPTPREQTFAYDGFEASVRTTRPALLGWLAEFLAPWFTTRDGPARAGAPRVEVAVDAAGLSAELARAEPTGRTVDVYTLDGARRPWPIVGAEGAGALAVDPLGQVAIEAAAGPRPVRILAAAERPHARLAAMRVLRELASADAVGRGVLPVHAAAVADDTGVTLFAGPRKAGKSTLLLHALLRGGVRYVANDRAFVVLGSARATVLGMPTIVSLREATLALAPALRTEITSKAWHYAATIAEARAHRASGEAAEGIGGRWPPGLSPAQLVALLGVEARAGGALSRIVLPEIAPGGPRFALRRLAPEQAAARLLAAGLVAGGRPATFVAAAPPGARDALAAAGRALAARVPCFACAHGPDAYEPPSVWDAIREL